MISLLLLVIYLNLPLPASFHDKAFSEGFVNALFLGVKVELVMEYLTVIVFGIMALCKFL